MPSVKWFGRFALMLFVLALAACGGGANGTPPARVVKDDFGDGVTGNGWLKYGSFTHEQQGSVQVSPPSAGGYGGYVSRRSYDLTGHYVEIHVRNAGDQQISSLEVYLVVKDDQGNSLSLRITGGVLYARQSVRGKVSTLGHVRWSSPGWLRISEVSGTAYWEYGPDGADMVVLFQAPDPIFMTDLLVEFGAGTWAPEKAKTTVVFDDYISGP